MVQRRNDLEVILRLLEIIDAAKNGRRGAMIAASRLGIQRVVDCALKDRDTALNLMTILTNHKHKDILGLHEDIKVAAHRAGLNEGLTVELQSIAMSRL